MLAMLRDMNYLS